MSDYDGWDDYKYETDVFKYNYNQFLKLRTTTLGLSCVSLVSSIFIFVVYICMLVQHRQKVNRVSLRCVFLCSIVDTLNAILNIISTHRLGGTVYCRAASVILVTTNLLSASLLTIVGLNLVLIFVLKVSRTDLFEKFYYPGVIIYALLGTVGPIYQEATGSLENMNQYSCWYFIYIEDRTYSIFSWMWFYGFLFFVNIIAILCSVAAMTKLLHEQRVFDMRMGNISKNALFSSKQSNLKLKQNHNNVFTKVVLRCIIYPLVPFLVNIFGFILQMVITTSDENPGFSLAMLDIVFSCIEGLFVAIVFFTDPGVTSFFKERIQDLCEKYVHQYTLVHVSNYDVIRRRHLSPADPYSHFLGSTAASCFNYTMDHSSHEKTTTKEMNKNMMPIRCVRLDIGGNNNNYNNTLSVATKINSIENTAALLPSFPNVEYKCVYIPYSYPKFTKYIHWFLRCLGVKPRERTKTEDSSGSSSSSTGSWNVGIPLISKPKNVLFTDTM